MTRAEFAAVTRRVIKSQGFDDFQPTACFPLRHDIRTLAGLPAEADVRPVLIEWARTFAGPDEGFLVAFKTSSSTFCVVSARGTVDEEVLFDVDSDQVRDQSAPGEH